MYKVLKNQFRVFRMEFEKMSYFRGSSSSYYGFRSSSSGFQVLELLFYVY